MTGVVTQKHSLATTFYSASGGWRGIGALLLVILGSIALPGWAYFIGDMESDLVRQRAELGELRSYQEQLTEARREALHFESFRDLAHRFYREAGEKGLAVEQWNRHEVIVPEKQMDLDELAEFIRQTGSGPRKFFVPDRLEITRGALPQRNEQTARHTSQQLLLKMRGTYLLNIR